ncbi:MAG: hypothetical protein AAF127_10280 [Pseudomonadota bacterium]
MMDWLFASGHAADIVLVSLALEAAWLRSRGWSWTMLAGSLGSAAMVVLALRAALLNSPWYWIAAPVLLSFPLHLVDLRARMAERE